MARFFDTNTYKNDSKLFDTFSKTKITCKHCGHKVVMTKTDRTLCTWCKHYIYLNDQVEFKYKMKEALNKSGK